MCVCVCLSLSRSLSLSLSFSLSLSLTGMHGVQEREKDVNLGYMRRLANLDFEDKVEVKALQVSDFT